MNHSAPVTFDYVRAIFEGLDPDNYDIETAKLLNRAGEIFEFYRLKSNSDQFMTPDEIQSHIRKLTSVVCTLTPRLGFYECEEMRTYWNKGLVRVTKRHELYKNKSRDKLTDKLIETISDHDEGYIKAVNKHLTKADFANRLRLVIRSCQTMLESLRAEMINLQVERKYSGDQK
jgi:hypothetical protein